MLKPKIPIPSNQNSVKRFTIFKPVFINRCRFTFNFLNGKGVINHNYDS